MCSFLIKKENNPLKHYTLLHFEKLSKAVTAAPGGHPARFAYTTQLLVSVRECSQPGAQREPVLKVLTHAPRQPGSHYEPGKGRHRGPARQGSGG